jgi:hypothetical protein
MNKVNTPSEAQNDIASPAPDELIENDNKDKVRRYTMSIDEKLHFYQRLKQNRVVVVPDDDNLLQEAC